MKKEDNIFNCFFKVGFNPDLDEQELTTITNVFKTYIWGERGIEGKLKKFKYESYGKDLELILFQFYVKPPQIELQKIVEIEPYRKNEKAIGIPIIVTDENFFSKSEEERYRFLNQSIVHKLDTLAKVVKQKKLDTKIEKLSVEVQKDLG